MQCHAHRPLAHAKMLGRLADRAPIDANRGHGGALAGRKGIKDTANLAFADGLRFELCRDFGNLPALDLHPATATAIGVNELMARNGIEPGRYGCIMPPRMALDVDCKQRFLNNILRVDSSLHSPPDEATHETSSALQETVVGTSVTSDCRSQ